MRNSSKTIIILILLLLVQANFAQESKTEDKEPAKIVVEKMPHFPGGDSEMIKFLKDNVRYPIDAVENCIRGRVTARFIVAKDGSIDSVEIVKSVYPSLDAEAVRVIKSMPRWVPGVASGKPVAVYFTLPIIFAMHDCDDAVDKKNTPLTPKDLEAIDDDDHPNKAKLLGVWEYEPEKIKYSYTFKDKEKEKIYGKEVGESMKKGRVLLVEGARGSTLEFKADNILVTTNLKDGVPTTSVGYYKLQDDKLFMHSIILGGTKTLTYKVEKTKLTTNMLVSTELMDVTFIMTLKKIK